MKSIARASLFSLLFASSAFANTYEIDPSHSLVGFKVKHLAISNVFGKFTTFQGNFAYNPAEPTKASVEAVITVNSINTDEKKRDDHLRSNDFFNAQSFPEMKFKSKEVKEVNGKSFKVAGDLTIRDVTKPVVLDVTYEGSATDPWGKERAAFSASTKINRRDFGLSWNKLLETGALVVGDEVTIQIEVEGTKKAS